MTFLLRVPKFGQHGGYIITTDELGVFYVDKLRTKKTHELMGVKFNEVEKIGTNKNRLALRPRGNIRTGRGHTGRSDRVYAAATAAGLKMVLRRLRPEEAGELAALDQRIMEAEQVVEQLRDEREAMVKQAWGRAHVVRLKEALDLIPEHG